MEVVLGVSMTPTAVRMVLVEGADADGVTVDHLSLSGSVEQVVGAILGTRESAIDGGHRLVNVGVAWTDHAAAARLREALRPLDIAEVTLVSELHAASSLAVAIGRKTDCRRTALLFVEQNLATLAVVQTADGAVVRVSSRSLSDAGAVEDVLGMVAALETLADPPQAVFVVGPGAAADTLAARLPTVTALSVQRPDDAELALARGAALACASAPRFDAETVGLGSGLGWASENLKPDALSPVDAEPDPQAGTEAGPTLLAESGWALGYSALNTGLNTGGLAAAAWPEGAVGHTQGAPAVLGEEDTAPAADGEQPAERPALLLGSALTTIFVVGFMALVISLAVTIRPAVDSRPAENATSGAPGTPETIRAPLPVVQEAPRAVVMPMPAPGAAPAAPRLPAASVPAPAAPAPIPAVSAPAAPAPPAQVPGPALTAPQVLVPELIAALLPPVVAVPSGAAPGARYPTAPTAPTAPAAPGPSVAATATQPATLTTAPTTTAPTPESAPTSQSATTAPTTTAPTTTAPTTPSTTGQTSAASTGAEITSEQSATGIPAGTSTAVPATQSAPPSTRQTTPQSAGTATTATAPTGSAAPPPASRCAGLPDCPA